VDRCCLCDLLIDGPSLREPESGDACHLACLLKRVPEDAVIALIAAAILVLAPPIIVWAS
jgi:hypothetical protein